MYHYLSVSLGFAPHGVLFIVKQAFTFIWSVFDIIYSDCASVFCILHFSFFHFTLLIVTILLNVYGDVLYHKALYIVYKFTWFYPFGKDHGSEVVCHAPLYQVLCHHTGQTLETVYFIFAFNTCIRVLTGLMHLV